MIVDGLQPKYLDEVIDILAEYMGKDACRDREELLLYINEFRETLYIDNKVPMLFNELWKCIQPSCYPMECYNNCDCENTFYGFVLPEDFENIEQAFVDDKPLRLHSSWWESRVGRQSGKCITDAIIPTDKVFPTERALKTPSNLVILTDSEKDCGKSIIITIVDECLMQKKVEVKLNNEVPQMIEETHGIVDVQIPQKLVGCVTLQQEDGYVLSQYNKYTTVPRFRLYKVTICKCKHNILIKGKKKFQDLCWDSDIVEVGSRLILKQFAKYIKYGDDSLDASEINKAERAKAEMYRLIGSAYENKHKEEDEDSFYNFGGFDLIPESQQLC